MAIAFFRSSLLIGVTALAASTVITGPPALTALTTVGVSGEAKSEIRAIVEVARADIATLRTDILDGHLDIMAARQQAAVEVRELLDGADTDRDAVEAVIVAARDDAAVEREMIAAVRMDIRTTRDSAAADIIDVVGAGTGETAQEIIAIVTPAREAVSAQRDTIVSAMADNRELRRGATADIADIVDSVKADEIDKEAAAEEIAGVIEANRNEIEDNKETARQARATIKSTRKDTASAVRGAIRDRDDPDAESS